MRRKGRSEAAIQRRQLPAVIAWPLCAALLLASGPPVSARQLRVSPGPLARAHSTLEGVANCGRCHEPGQGITAARCLTCHKQIATRIAAKAGVHRAVTTDCARCHREHGGAEADLRPIDRSSFNHALETGFPLDGQHARIATNCAACHKGRSFLAARAACETCHRDVHRATFGPKCTRCHSTAVPFRQSRREFDHGGARFVLTGRHREVACEKCHVGGFFRGFEFGTCDACHKPPHRRALGPSCAGCHATDSWSTGSGRFEHGRAGFALVGAHARVVCAKCHPSGVGAPLHADRCAACHASVHGTNFNDDCRACHNEAAFRPARFDHAERTRFPLAGAHQPLACRKCHTRMSGEEVPLSRKVVDFRGLAADCVACHKDEHKGEFGRACDQCHRPVTFKVAGFAHPRRPEFFGGRHAGVACARCHVRPGPAPSQDGGGRPTALSAASPPPTACVGCHADVHLGQLGTGCERCHSVEAARFSPVRFSHDAGRFPLTGKHRGVDCGKCHPTENSSLRSGIATTRRFRVSPDCRACHADPHLGQADRPCGECHTADSFRVLSYPHPGQDYLFSVASHDRLPCRTCHKAAGRRAGGGVVVPLKLGRGCIDCHP